MNDLRVYTDGSVCHVLNVAGWAFVSVHGYPPATRDTASGSVRFCSGSQDAEYRAIYEALKWLDGIPADIHTDSLSAYLILARRSYTDHAIAQRILCALRKSHETRIRYVRGHAGDPWNERAHTLAKQAMNDERAVVRAAGF